MEFTSFATEIINGKPVQVYGTVDAPMFLSTDLGTMIGSTRPSTIIKDFNKTEKLRGNIKSGKHTLSANLLTRAGTIKFFTKTGKEIPQAINKYINPPAVTFAVEATGQQPTKENIDIIIPEMSKGEMVSNGTVFIGELLKDMFNDKEVRILGTIEEPLFVAGDIGDILGIQNIRESIKHFDESERSVSQIYTSFGSRETTLLTEFGLYRLLGASNKPEARPFQKWVFRIIREIRLKGAYNLEKDTEAQQLVIQHKEEAIRQIEEQNRAIIIAQQSQIYDLELRLKTATSVPSAPQVFWDFYEFNDKPCIYIFHLRDHDYKFGRTSNIIKRAESHRCDFRKYGCDISTTRLWECASVKIMKEIEARIKQLAKLCCWFTPKYDKYEIITCPDVAFLITRVDTYIKELNALDERIHQTKMREYELAAMELKSKTDIKMAELAIRKQELDLEYYRLRCEGQSMASLPMITAAPDEISCEKLPENVSELPAPINDFAIPSVTKSFNLIDSQDKIRCACGKTVNIGSYPAHLKSKIHIKHSLEQTKEI